MIHKTCAPSGASLEKLPVRNGPGAFMFYRIVWFNLEYHRNFYIDRIGFYRNMCHCILT